MVDRNHKLVGLVSTPAKSKSTIGSWPQFNSEYPLLTILDVRSPQLIIDDSLFSSKNSKFNMFFN